ncbi:MAG: squalene--hopene cyclase [Armatimonadetes bacterium]|nr:squalene--hopene cyclase [Armatimonadota bacterium]
MVDRGRLERGLRIACDRLLAERVAGGWWEGRLSSSALATATAVSALAVAGESEDAALIRRGVDWLDIQQLPDGSWGDTPDSPGNLSTTLLVLSALRLARDQAVPPSVPARAMQFVERCAPGKTIAQAVRDIYGADRTFAVPILMNCALAGLVAWEDVPGLPFELAALPRAFYKGVRLQVVSYALPALIAVGLVISRHHQAGAAWSSLRRALTPALRSKLATLQPQSGGFLEATPLTAFVAMSLADAFGAGDPVLQRCLWFLRASARVDGSWPIDTNLSTWVTTLALNALEVAAPEADVSSARDWVAGQQWRAVHPYTGAAPGGWAWTDLSGGVPDADDTSGALLALADRLEPDARESAVRWLLELQNADGGWPTFCRGWGRLPFDQSCPDITAHTMRALKSRGIPRSGRAERAMERGLAYLAASRNSDGSWDPLWFGNQAAPGMRNPVVGTARVLPALPEGPLAAEARTFLRNSQNPDGGWGGAPGVASSIEETALAVNALALQPEESELALAAGVSYLLSRIEDDSWTRPSPVGLYFSRLWYSEKLYPVVWTVEALGRIRSKLDIAREQQG